MLGLHPFFHRMLYRMPMPRWWRTLSWASATHRVTRSADDALDVALVDGAIQAPAFQAGRVVELDGMRVAVLGSDARGPTQVRVTLDRSLDDPDVVLLAWEAGRFRHVAPPRLGETLTIDGSELTLDDSDLTLDISELALDATARR
jgi:hypothetical protein